MVDGGYDISDYRDVNEIYGTKEDLTELFEKAKELDLKIILDFVSFYWLFEQFHQKTIPSRRFQITRVKSTNGSTNRPTATPTTSTIIHGASVQLSTKQPASDDSQITGQVSILETTLIFDCSIAARLFTFDKTLLLVAD
jgi:hypothetical protein